jgi:hypothetical protein
LRIARELAIRLRFATGPDAIVVPGHLELRLNQCGAKFPVNALFQHSGAQVALGLAGGHCRRASAREEIIAKGTTTLIVLPLLMLLIGSCVPGPNSLSGIPSDEGHTAGFWHGLWHGIIAPVTFVVSLFRPGVQMYEVHNNGIAYNLGFLLGILVVFGGGGSGAAKRK